MAGFRSFVFLVVFAVAGCATAEAPQLYLLDAAPMAGTPDGAEKPILASLRKVELPRYAASRPIVTLGTGARLEADRDHRWADPLDEAVTRSLASGLGDALDAAILIEPSPLLADATFRIDVAFDRFLGIRGERVEIAGQYAILDRRPGHDNALKRFAISAPVAGEDYDALVAGFAAAIDRLSADLAKDLSARRSKK